MAFPPPPRPPASATVFQAPRPASAARLQPRRPPRRRASWALRLVYCLALIAPFFSLAVFPGSDHLAALYTSEGELSLYRIIALLLVAARFVFVLVRPRALQGYVALPLFRPLSIAAMVVGSILAVASLFAKPIALWLFGTSHDAGIGVAALGMVFAHGSYLAALGVVVFELTRAIGELKAAFARVADRLRSRDR